MMAKPMREAGWGGKRAGSGPKPRPVESLREARRRTEVALADLRQMEVARRRGELLEAAAVAREWADVLRAVRVGVFAAVSRIRQHLLHLTAHDIDVIDRELRDALTALANEQSENA